VRTSQYLSASKIFCPPGFGHAEDPSIAELASVCEALERQSSVPFGKRPAIRESYGNLRERALDPRSLVLHSRDLSAGDPLLVPYDDDLVICWTEAYSLRGSHSILVPFQAVYYGRWTSASSEYFPSEPVFIYETSNGCAIGACIEEAIIHAILELVERDAFLLTWYAKRSPVRLRASTWGKADQILARMWDYGYDVNILDITAPEFGIPSVWLLAVGRDRRVPATVSTAAARLNFEDAIYAAALELASVIPAVERRFDVERARRLLRDPELVVSMGDHSQAYAAPEARGQLEFLLSGPVTSFVSQDRCAERRDLRAILVELVERFARCGLDVLVADTTTLEQERLGLTCVKVLIPGLLPMTFGHRRRRLEGAWRLAGALRGSVNPLPHPFP
jgi:ribosomal protein S12 methylthiotransferase accessory factor